MKTRLLISFVFVGVVIFGITNASGILDEVFNQLSNDLEDDLPIDCKGILGKCFSSTISRIVDGDTIHDGSGDSIRLVLVNSPEMNTNEGIEAKEYLEKICPVGSTVIVDEDDGQLQGSYGRVIGLVYCEDDHFTSLNEKIIDNKHGKIYKRFCDSSEFGNKDWVIEHGC